MERNIKNNINPYNSKFLDIFEQNNAYKENFISKEAKLINKELQKHKSPMKYTIGVKIPPKSNNKQNKDSNNFKKTRNKKDIFIKNTDENSDKKKGYKLNYEINDYFVKDYNEKRKRKNKSKNKFLEEKNSSLNNLEFENNQINTKQKFQSNKNLGLQLTLKTTEELNDINKNKLIFSSSLQNLKNITNKTTNNISSNFSQTINTNNLSIKIPFQEINTKEILDILNLNNNININQNENMTRSNSNKSFSFTRRKKPYNQMKNMISDDSIDNILKSNPELNREDENNIMKLKEEINKIKEEYNKIKYEKTSLETTNMIMQNQMRYFYQQKELEKDNFEKYKQNEIKKLANEKNKIAEEAKTLNELKKKYQNKKYSLENNNIKTDKKNNDKELIEIYKNQLNKANDEISKLTNIIKNLNINLEKNYSKENSKNTNNKTNLQKVTDNSESNKSLVDNEDESEDNEDDSYDLILPDKYHSIEYNLKKTEKNKDGCIIKKYDKNKIEKNLINGDKIETYDENYEIIYYSNGDIKQTFKNQNKEVYFFKEQNIVKTTLAKGLEIIKHKDNNSLEKIFKNGTKKISLDNGYLKYILPNGLEETYFPDGRVERKSKDGNIIMEK